MSKQKLNTTIRAAKPEEADELSALARRSKARWGYDKAWLEAWRKDLTVTAELIENSIAYDG